MRTLLPLKGHGDQRRLFRAGRKQMSFLPTRTRYKNRELHIDLSNSKPWEYGKENPSEIVSKHVKDKKNV